MAHSVYTSARRIQHRLGCSILPLEGKRPARTLRTWEQWRDIQPIEAQLEDWFVSQQLTAYGVILGQSAAGLFVLDFDDPQSYHQFCTTHPNLSQTFTVQTRRGYHVYLRSETLMNCRKINGGDLKGEGGYVVGAGSIVNGYQYSIHCDEQVITLSPRDTESLFEQPNNQQIEERTTEITIAAGRATDKQLQSYYSQKARQIGRNNALYNTARYARYTGISESDTYTILSQLHSQTPPNTDHHGETEQQRQREAQRTIQSAYKTESSLARKPDISVQQTQEQGQLPNSISEALLQETNSTAPGRLIEGLYQSDYPAGATISKTEAYTIGRKYHISERDIRTALHYKHKRRSLFKKHSHSHTQPPPVGEADNLNSKSEYTEITGGNLGRPIRDVFEIPSVDDLCELLGVTAQAADPLSEADLCSAKAYRQALHRELIKRRAPEQSTRWHAERLNTSQRTIRRYNSELGVIRTPIIAYAPITWANVDDPALYGTPVGPADFTAGQWLQREDGKRYPALKGIALRELSEKATLIACWQRPSRLQLPTSDQPLIVYEVLWRRSDHQQGDWGGGPWDFPPVDPPPVAYQPDIEAVSPPIIEDDGCPVVNDPPITGAYRFINEELTMIQGIGRSRAERLMDVGIWTMSQLIAAGAENLAGIGWAGGYVTERTTLGWIEQAEILLGRRKVDPAVAAAEQARQEHREIMRRFKRDLKSFGRYLDCIYAWEDAIFGTGDFEPVTWNMERRWLATHYDEGGRLQDLTPAEVKRIKGRVSDFIMGYLERIDLFLVMSADHLERWGFGDHKGWKALRRRGLTVHRHFIVVPGATVVKKP